MRALHIITAALFVQIGLSQLGTATAWAHDCEVRKTQLWPPNHDLVNVGFSVIIRDPDFQGATITVRVYSDEDDEEQTGDGRHSPDAKNIAPNSLRLRSERKGNGDGRVYLIIGTITKGSRTETVCCVVTVPHDQSARSIQSVRRQGQAALDYCEENGAPPPGFVRVGDGPTLGPKQ